MSRPSAPSPAATAATAAAVLGCLLCLVLLPAAAASAVSDVAQGLAAFAGAAGAARHARVVTGRTRGAWVLIAAACSAWALGETYWCWQTLRGHAAPFPSLADAGFLGFAVLMAAALMVHPAPGGGHGFTQRLLDGLMCAGAVGLVSWLTTLASVADAAAGEAQTERLLLLAYPVSDVLLVVLTVLLLARAGHRHPALWLVGAGVLALGVSDSAFAAFAANGLYNTGLLDLGWIGGFLVIGVAGTCPHLVPEQRPDVAAPDGPAPSASALPYVPVLAALSVTIGGTVMGQTLTRTELLGSCFVVLCLLARQYLAVRENARLARALAAGQQQLRQQAFTDPLTGLSNRALFSDRLEHALALHARHGRPVALLFLDIDDFKAVNDTFGHAAGDDLLVEVARRAGTVVRDGDTVARLGGDEFAVLLEDTADPRSTGERLGAVLATPFDVVGTRRTVRVSLGMAEVRPADGPTTADELLARADAAMYAAKRAAKRTGEATPARTVTARASATA